jgi:microsomal dipeptidase-like Zn-dependent dipeptidase
MFSFAFFSIYPSFLFSQEKPSGKNAKSYVVYLADDALDGRDTGTAGFEKAAKWVSDKFSTWGLKPAGENGTYFQEFPLSVYKSDFDYPKLMIDERQFYYSDRDFSIMQYSGGGIIEGEVVFAGYGITSKENGLDEYDGLDVEGKVVLVMQGCPEQDKERWEGVYTDSAKAMNAFRRGAKGMLLCANFGEKERGIGYWRLRPGNYQANFIVYSVDERVVRFILMGDSETSRRFTRRMRESFRMLDKDLEPMSKVTGKKVNMEVKVEFDDKCIGKNVLGIIPGVDPDVGLEVIVLGAHLDHLGIRYNQVYNGADDNASGSAVLMEVARVMMANRVEPRRTILFACWGGEERGLIGSTYYGNHPILPIEKTVLNFNMDMVGVGKKLNFPGIYYAPKIWDIIKNNVNQDILDFIEPSRGGPGGSDHTPFITRGIPAFALMTSPWGSHKDYHQPEDDSEKIDAELLGMVAEFVYDQLLLIADYDGNLIQKNRHPIYIHKSAPIVNLHTITYEESKVLLDSLKKEWVKVQFVEIPLPSVIEPSDRLSRIIKVLDEINYGKRISRSQAAQPLYMMFRGRNEKVNTIVGLRSAESVNRDLAFLRTTCRMGAKFLILTGFDGKWIDESKGVTGEGKKAIKIMNAEKMMIILQNLPEKTINQCLATSKHPVIVAGVTDDILSWSDVFFKKLKKNGGLLALNIDPESGIGETVKLIHELKKKIDSNNLGLYPYFGSELNVENIDKLLDLTISLKNGGMDDREITNILGGNYRTILGKISPSDRTRMMRR